MDAMIFAKCVEATAVVAICRTVVRVIRSWFPRIFAIAQSALGGHAKQAHYIAVASSLSPPK